MSNQFEFKAEVQKVLKIITHSLYTHREIFLRELISNSSDALDKLRYKQSKSEDFVAKELALDIKISFDKDKNYLLIQDSGIGMTKDDLIENLGTIAKSGSEQFIKDLSEVDSKDANNIIGRFGIGFYSVFMVADKVEVISRSINSPDEAYTWSSDGLGSFEVSLASPEDNEKLQRGTIIRAYLKEDAKEYLEKWRIETVIRSHSNFISFPIYVEDEQVNTNSALWREPKFNITKEQYNDFYKFISYSSSDPLDTIHLSVDAPVQFNSLLFIPDEKIDFFTTAGRESWGPDLYVRRVLIQKDNKELLPEYLAFMKGVVDTEDLPLNISRETLQENIVLRKIAQTITKQVLNHLENLAKNEPELYAKFWKHHSTIFKLSYQDYANRDKTSALLRFNTSYLDDGEKLSSLDEYIDRVKTEQKEIWYLSAPNRAAAEANPHLEVFKRKGIEVLFMYEPIDEFVVESIGIYKEFNFKAIEHFDSESLNKFADSEENKSNSKPLEESEKELLTKLLAKIKDILKDQIEDVRISKRLADSPACLVSADEHTTSTMAKLMRVMQKDDSIPKKIFEINEDHILIRDLLLMYKNNDQDNNIDEIVEVLYNNSLLLDGYIKDPYELAAKSNKLLEKASAWYLKK